MAAKVEGRHPEYNGIAGHPHSTHTNSTQLLGKTKREREEKSIVPVTALKAST